MRYANTHLLNPKDSTTIQIPLQLKVEQAAIIQFRLKISYDLILLIL